MEYYPFIDKVLTDLYLNDCIDHLQFTLPNTNYSYYRIISNKKLKNIPRIVHSNLLNVFGENDIDELKVSLEKINNLSPVFVIEHFTLLRTEKRKNAVSKVNKKFIDNAIYNLKEWNNQIEADLLIENTPITEDVIEYYEQLLKVAEECNIGINIDIPHLIIGLASLRPKEAQKVLVDLKESSLVKHIHVGGISKKSNTLEDMHDGQFCLAMNFKEKYFPDLSCTWEQSANFKNKEVILKIIERSSAPISNLFEDLFQCKTKTIVETNKDLIMNNTKIMREALMPEQEMTKELFGTCSEFDYFFKFLPFVEEENLLLRKSGNSLVDLKLLVKYLKIIGNFNSWFSKKEYLLEVDGKQFSLSDLSIKKCANELYWNVQIENKFIQFIAINPTPRRRIC